MVRTDKYAVYYVGLDGEMTGNSGPSTFQLIQIGLASPHDSFSRDIGYKHGSYAYQEEALKVCKFDQDRIERGASPAEVDLEAVKWLDQHYPPPISPWPTGFGVSYFDLPYVATYLPKTYARLGKPCADLRVRCQFLEEVCAIRGMTELNFRYWMDGAKDNAKDRLGREDWHDAGFDAEAALLCHEWLTKQLADLLAPG
jgi:hypothetical protein